MKIVNKNEEKMFGRTSFSFELEKVGTTPSRAELQKKIAASQKTDATLVVVTEIKKITGSANVFVFADVYADATSYKLHVPSYLAKKSEVKEEVKEETKDEEKEVQAPKEEESTSQEAPANDATTEPATEERKEGAE